jgi:cell division protein FtsQ
MDAETYPQEVLAEEEPRYLRRQKPIEIKRRKFGKKAWKSYLRAALLILAVAAVGGALYATGNFLFTSQAMALASPAQVETGGNHYVSRASVLEVFAPDRGRSVLLVPLAARRAQIEALPWVEHAAVRRALPNRIQVEITERTPVAFLREGTSLYLVDAQGVILDRPLEGDFHFPVVTGISSEMPRDERALRMQLFSDFLSQIQQVRPGAADYVSEADLSDATDLRTTLAGLPGMVAAAANSADGAESVLVHFGNSDFANKFQVLLNNIGQWEAAAGRIASVDLRFQKEVVVNPEMPSPVAETAAAPMVKAEAAKPETKNYPRPVKRRNR